MPCSSSTSKALLNGPVPASRRWRSSWLPKLPGVCLTTWRHDAQVHTRACVPSGLAFRAKNGTITIIAVRLHGGDKHHRGLRQYLRSILSILFAMIVRS